MAEDDSRSRAILDDWIASAKRFDDGGRLARAAFEDGITNVWGDALRSFDMLVLKSVSYNELVHRHLMEWEAQSVDVTLLAVFKLQARSCTVASEISALLRTGHADGALARWRLLHELNVTMNFVHKHGTKTAQRYLNHATVRSYQAFCKTGDSLAALNERPLPAEDAERLRSEYRGILERHPDPAYLKQYGWAYPAIDKKQISFGDIADDVDLGHMVPYTAIASERTHAGSHGLAYTSSLEPGSASSIVIGPTGIGLDFAGRNSCESFGRALACFLDAFEIPDLESHKAVVQQWAILTARLFDEATKSAEIVPPDSNGKNILHSLR